MKLVTINNLLSPVIIGITIIVLCCFLFPTQSYSSDTHNFKFRHITPEENGISSSGIRDIVQDHFGFMWFLSDYTVDRYDGYRFTSYKPDENDSTSISRDFPSCLFEDHNGNLWIGTEGGADLYNRELDNFRFYHTTEDKRKDYRTRIYSFAEDSLGRLWACAHVGLLYFDPQFQKFKMHTRFISAERIVVYDNETIFVGSEQHGLSIVNVTNKTNKEIGIFDRELNREGRINCIIKDMKGRIWAGTGQSGLVRIDMSNKSQPVIDQFFPEPQNNNSILDNSIRSLEADRNGGIWIGYSANGLTYLHPDNKTFTHYKHNPNNPFSIGDGGSETIYQDRNGDIWIGNKNNLNVLHFLNQQIRHYYHIPGELNGLSANSVYGFSEDKQGTVWIRCGNGINSFNPNTGQFVRHNSFGNIDAGRVNYIYHDSEGNAWFIIDRKEILFFDKKTKVYTLYNSDNTNLPPSVDDYTAILEDSKKRIWIGTWWNGLIQFDRKTNEIRQFNVRNKKLYHDHIFALAAHPSGKIIYGGRGVTVFNPDDETYDYYTWDKSDDNSLNTTHISSIYVQNDSLIWIGSVTGLNKLNLNSKINLRYFEEDGLPGNRIIGIIADHHNHLWISTNKGLSKYNPENNTFKNYKKVHGLQGGAFLPNSCFKSSRNLIFFGGEDGFNIIDPDQVKDNPDTPNLVITDFKIFNKSVKQSAFDSPLKMDLNTSRHVTLSYKHSVFTFEFSALNYVSPDANQYAYRLKGFDPPESGWNYVGLQHSATYTNIDPGEYLFQVKGSNSDGVWNEEPLSIKVTIVPPFWETWWFRSLFITIIVLIVSSLFIYQKIRAVQQQKLLEKKVAERTDELRIANEKLKEEDEQKFQFFTNISHEFRTPVSLISAPIKKAINSTDPGETKKLLSIVERNANRLLRLVNQLMEFRKIDSGKMKIEESNVDVVKFIKDLKELFDPQSVEHVITYRFESDQEKFVANIDIDKVETVVFNLLSNAFRFTPKNGNVSVILQCKKSKIIDEKSSTTDCAKITIKDTGAGIPQDKLPHIFNRFYQVKNAHSQSGGTGIGLALTKELTEHMNGLLSIHSREGEGTEISITIPVNQTENKAQQSLPDKLDLRYTDKYLSVEGAEWDESTDTIGDEIEEQNTITDNRRTEILIIEDNDDMRLYLKNELKDYYKILVAANGQVGLDLAIKHLPSLIVSDIMMPEIDGIELCRRIKTDINTSHIPVILLTARNTVRSTIEGLDTGADAYLIKPFDTSILKAQIKNLIVQRNKLKELFSQQIYLEPSKISITKIDESFLKKAFEIIEENISDQNFQTRDFISKMNLSKSCVYKKIKALTGFSVSFFIRTIRLKRAAQLLSEDKNILISEVAYQVGFDNIPYFSLCFKKQIGCSPSDYRKV